MKYDSPVARATLLAVISEISAMADEREREQDMDGYWTCISMITRLVKEFGAPLGGIDQHMRDGVLAAFMQTDLPPSLV